MLLQELLSVIAAYWPIILLVSVTAYFVSNKYNRGLNKYPGHWLASYTDAWRLFDVLSRQAEQTHIKLHRQHGDIVRLGPNVLSFADPRAIKIIYGLNKGMIKSEFYPVQSAIVKGRRLPSLFSTTDETFHASYRRCINSAFAMSSLVSYEPLVNNTLDCYLEQTQKRYAETGAKCSFSKWLQFFAFDVIGELTWSKRLGFIEKGEDVGGIVKFVESFLAYAGPVGQMPLLDLILQKNVVKMALARWGFDKKVFPVVQFSQERSAERAKEMDEIRANGIPADRKGAIDLLSKFTAAQHDHPDTFTDLQVLSTSNSMVFAGSETTAISLSSVFYYLLKNPQYYKKLMSEIDNAVRNGVIEARENGAVSWTEAQKLPYLDAVIQESFRLHPAPGLILERIVPPQGMDILGFFIPGGAIVGCNPWVVHRHKPTFGDDVDVFRPERWLESSPAQLKEMRAAMFQFGAGARTCIGKNISLLEIYKLVPSFLRRFEVQWADEQKWKSFNAWFVRHVDFDVRFKPRALVENRIDEKMEA